MIAQFFSLVFILLNIPYNGSAQNIHITYNYLLLDLTNNANAEVGTASLLASSSESLYSVTFRDTTFEYTGGSMVTDGGYTTSYYKNVRAKEMVYQERSLGGRLFVKDIDYAPNWEIKSGTKQILGYNCMEAATEYRGRKYTVWFSPDFGIENGPFKFDGLPGLILEIKSLDGAVHIYAQKIARTTQEVVNPFSKESFISWEELKKRYRKKYETVINSTTDENIYVSIPSCYIECYID